MKTHLLLITMLSTISIRTASQDTKGYKERWNRAEAYQIADEVVHRVLVQDAQNQREHDEFTHPTATKTIPLTVKPLIKQ